VAEYGIVLAKDVMVPMRDGIRLASDVYRPARDGALEPGRWPAILCRTPYDKTDRRYTEIADHFTPRGYAVVLQDVRDRYRSEGTREYSHTTTPHEGRDGYDTIEWLAAQPWSNGKVGMVGSSFAAITQVRAALERPPHLAAIWPDVVPTNNYLNQSREGGAMQLHMFWALFIHAQDAQDIAGDAGKQAEVWDDLRRLRELLASMPWRPGELSLRHVPALEQALFDYYTRGAYDDWWAQEANDYSAHWDRHADVPGVFSTGWFDAFPHADTEYFAEMARRNATPQRLVVGPWSHVGMRGDVSHTLDVDFGPESVWGVARYFAEQDRFFDRWLGEGAAAPGPAAEDEPPVRIFVMGGGSGRRNAAGRLEHGGRWRHEREWPLARMRPTVYHLIGDGSLAPEPPPAGAQPLEYDFDPEHPVPSIGGLLCQIAELPDDGASDQEAMWTRFLNPVLRLRNILAPGPAHQRESPGVFGAREPYPLLCDRPDVLAFRTAPLREPVELTGPVSVRLWVASSALDTDFTAKLVDEYPPGDDYPDGYHLGLVDSIIRCRYREGWAREVLLEPGRPVQVAISLPPTSNLFAAGHRIRIDISSSNFPRLDVNPNTGEPMGRHTHTLVARQSVFVDAERASHVVLPVIPPESASAGSGSAESA
jgi:putative CocE/NonD family hydrolase